MKTRIALVTVLLSAVAPMTAQTVSTSEIVAAHYPDWLQAVSDAAEIDAPRQQCSAVYDAQANGQPSTIIAAYTNGTTAALRALRATAGGFTVIDEPRDLDLIGTRCRLDLIDVDGDGRREVHLRLSNNMDTAHWLLRWDGQRLTNLTPVEPAPVTGEPRTLLHNGTFVDVDLDGRLEFYGGGPARAREGEAPEPDRIWTFANGGFAAGEPVIGAFVFTRESGEPRTVSVKFSLPAGAQGPFRLEVRNGGSTGDAAVSSGQVAVNGVDIVRPADFRPSARLIERNVTLAAQNELTVRLTGSPGGRIVVILRSAAWAE